MNLKLGIRKRIDFGWEPSLIVKLILLILLFSVIVLPLLKMLAFIGGSDPLKLIQSPQFSRALKNSLASTLVATVASLSLAFLLAWSIARTGIKHKELFGMVMVIPMLIPSISHSTGLIILFGQNGILTKFLGLTSSIYGFWGIVWGSVLYSFPFAFIMILDILTYENYTPYEAAGVLGISKLDQFFVITLPYLRKPMISVIFSTFTVIFTDYGVPLAIGGKFVTLPIVMYQEVIGQLNFGKGSVIGAILLMPAVIAFVIDLLNKDKGNNSFVTKSFALGKNKMFNLFGYFVCLLTSLLIFLIILSFVVLSFTVRYPIDLSLTFGNVSKTFTMNGFEYLMNSLVVSTIVTTLGVVIGFSVAYLTTRMPSKLTKSLHLIAMTSMAIPGIVLGLSYVLFFKGTIFYGTIAILVMVNIVHFSASPYLMMYNTLGKVNGNIEAVGKTLGLTRFQIIVDIIIPQVKTTLIEMGSYFFVNSMITISAVSFLSTTANKQFSLMINQFEALMLLECSAVVSLVLLSINLLLKGSIYLAKRHMMQGTR